MTGDVRPSRGTDDLVLALDVGSSWCKAAYVDRAGHTVASGAAWVRDERLFGHDDAALTLIWDGLRAAIDEAGRQIGGQPRLAALGVAARKAPGIWLDGAGQPIGLPIGEVEGAGRAEIDACYASPVWGNDDPFAYGYGLDLIGNTRWLWRRHPEEWARVRRAGTLHSWLLYRLTGRWATSHAGGPVRDAWPDAVGELTGLPAGVYPAVVSDIRILGPLHPRASDALGLPLEAPVVTGTHDGAAANIGAGALDPGDACLTFGTNGVLRVVAGARIPGRFGYTVTGRRWALVRDLPDLALLLDSVVTAIDGQDGPVIPERHQELSSLAERVPAGAHGLRLRLFPDGDGLTAERALADGHHPVAVYRAALEAVAFGFTGLARYAQSAGATPERFFATGGATGNDLLMRITSACINAPLALSTGEAGLLGVAALAAVGVGWFDTVRAASSAMRAGARTIIAADAERAAYAALVASNPLPTGVAPGDGVANSSGCSS